jgi:predicted homoserine dehydrogenase-like protein
MIILDRALERRAAEGRPVRVGIVGAGYMARGIAAHASMLVGMELVAFSNRTPDRAHGVLGEIGREARAVATVQELEDAVAFGAVAVTDDASILCAAETVDVVIETTGEVEYGAGVTLEAIARGKHVVLVNAELDATVGPILKVKADEAGVVLTNTDGDEPGVTMNLLRYVRTIGMRPVLVGNIKGFIGPYRTPATQAAFAESVGQGPKMITSFADGTKLSMEATIVANAAGLRVARRGMFGHRCAHVRDVLDYWDASQLLEADGFVDFVLEAEPGSGAFVVGHTDEPIPKQYLKYFKMGDGPFYIFYTPWHLPQAEAPLTAARAALFGDASVTPLGAPRCDVVAIAKRDLREGEVLDGIGGYTCYGQIENADVARTDGLLPMGLSEGCVLTRPVAVDDPIRYVDVGLPGGRLADALRREQDRFFDGAFA